MGLRRYRMRFRLIICISLLILLAFAGYVTAYLVRYSATSERICRQCHPDLSPLWRESNGHPADLTDCYQCHSRSFKLVPEGWNIFQHARDQIVQDVLDLNYKIKKKVITFNHRIHYGEGLECVDCHRTSGHEYMTGSTNRPTVSECLLCHIKEFEGPPKNRKCLNCHDVMLAPGRTWQ